MPQIAVVSNNIKEHQELSSLFKKEGIECINISEATAKNIDLLSNISPEIIMLDLELKGTDGIEVCHQLKNEKKISSFVILLSNKPEEYIQLEAFKVGADDYLVKAVNHRVLIKKLKAILRRFIGPKEPFLGLLSYKEIRVDTETHEVYRNKDRFYLPKKDFEILVLFLTSPNITYTREEIYQRVWNSQDHFNARIIDVHIRKIREKLGAYLIETVKGVGYKLAP